MPIIIVEFVYVDGQFVYAADVALSHLPGGQL